MTLKELLFPVLLYLLAEVSYHAIHIRQNRQQLAKITLKNRTKQ